MDKIMDIHMYTVCYFFVTILVAVNAEVSVNYTTSYPNASGYYIVNDRFIQLQCNYDEGVDKLLWRAAGRFIFTATNVDTTPQDIVHSNTDFTNRIINSTHLTGAHQLVIVVNKEQDEGERFTCYVRTESVYKTGHITINGILSVPQLATLFPPDYVLQDEPSSYNCTVPSVYPGSDVTEFRLKVGNQYYTQGTETETKIQDVYNITRTFTVNLSRNQNNADVLCEVTWMQGTSVETVRESETQQLVVYASPDSVILSTLGPVINGVPQTITCTVSSIYPGKNHTEFRLKVGTQYYTHGTETEIQEGTDITVTKTITLSFTRDQHGDDVLCEVTWMGGTRIETVRVSGTQQLVVYVPPESVILPVVDYMIEDESRSVQCIVPSVYPGKDSMQFRMKVGSQYYTYSTKTEVVSGIDMNVTATFILAFSRTQQGRVLLCEVTWMGGTNTERVNQSDSQLLKIYYPAAAVTKPSVSPASQLMEGTQVTLSCSADSYPSPRLRLYRQGVYFSTVRIVYSNTLTFTTKMYRDDHGSQYYCRAEDGGRYTGWQFDVTSEKQRIDVLFKATSVSIHSVASSPLVEGETLQITCETEANPAPILMLYKNVSQESGKVQVDSITGSVLQRDIFVQRQLNTVAFSCMATSSDSNVLAYTVSSSQINYTVKFSATSNTLAPEASDSVEAGNDKTLTCTTGSANPRVSSIVWRKGDTKVTSGVTSHRLAGEYGGEVLQSNYTFTAQKSDNDLRVSCTPYWDGRELTELKREIILDVIYPPVVSVTTTASTVDEGSGISVSCNIIEGNPQVLTTQFWEFEPKYPDSQSQALPDQKENRQLRIESTVYTDAGTYRCTAGNTVGSDTGEILVVVHYPPQLLNSDGLLMFYSGLAARVALSVTVRAFPEFPVIESAFLWTATDRDDVIKNEEIISFKLGEEIFQSQLTIESVLPIHYGVYTVTVDNGVTNAVTFDVELKPRGPPEAPRFVNTVAVAAEKLAISWIVGLNGGSQQTFAVTFKEPNSDAGTYINTEHVDPPTGTIIQTTIMNLKPETTYQVKVTSKNLYNGGSETSSNELSVTTRAKPVIRQQDLIIELKESTAKLYWIYQGNDWNYTTVIIQQCNMSTYCVDHNVTGFTDQSLTVALYGEDTFYLVIYQDGLEAYRSEPFVQVIEPSDDESSMETTRSSNQTGLIAGLVTAVVAVLLGVVLIVWLYRRRKSRQADGKTDPHPSDGGTYMNVIMRVPEHNYVPLKITDQSRKSLYEQHRKMRMSEKFSDTEVGIM